VPRGELVPRFLNIPVRQKLRRAMLVTSAVALVTACGSFIGYALVTARPHLTGEIQALADVVGANSGGALLSMDHESARETLAALSVDGRVQAGLLIDTEGRLFAEYRREGAGTLSLESHLVPEIRNEEGVIIVSRPVVVSGETVGTIVVSAGLDHAYGLARRYAVIAGWVLAISLAVAFGVSATLERLISRPLLELTGTAARVASSGDYSVRAKREGDDEIGQLVDSFNAMLEQIEERDAALREVNDRLEDRIQERTEELEREVEVRSRAEQEVRAALGEKDILIKEIHDRVKNNLQVISSLLNLQASHLEDDQARRALITSQGRLRSIALVHEMFYHSQNLARIDLPPYLTSATSYLLNVHGIDPQTVHMKVDCAPMHVAIDTAIPLGLIVHELTSNALKFAFPESGSGEIRVALQPNGSSVLLTVADDGVGIPEHVRWDQPTSLGFQLVHSLTRQLKGSIELRPDESGTCFTVSIPDRLFSMGD
jgi:two-component sensor histidine kinase